MEQSEEAKAEAGFAFVRLEGVGERGGVQVKACPAGVVARRDITQVRGHEPPQAGCYQSQKHHHLNCNSLDPFKMPGVVCTRWAP